MTPEQFTYWLNGFLELTDFTKTPMTTAQIEVIRKHMALVLTNVTNKQPLTQFIPGLQLSPDLLPKLCCATVGTPDVQTPPPVFVIDNLDPLNPVAREVKFERVPSMPGMAGVPNDTTHSEKRYC